MDGLGSLDRFVFEDFRFDLPAGGLFRTNDAGATEPVALGSRALAVLALLLERQGQLVSKDEIFAAVWRGIVVGEGNLTVQISTLRRVLDRDRTQGSCIQTIPGRGYRFVLPVTRFGSTATLPAEGGATIVDEAHWPEPEAVKSPDSNRVVARSAGRPVNPREIAAPRLSIVVLPFSNLSNDPEQEYFADGITDDLTIDLSRLAGMLVISRNTAFTYRDRSVDTRQIGRELCVRYVLEGSVRRSGPRVRVNVQLIDADTDTHLWAERCDAETSDLFAQDEVTRRIAVALNLELVAAEVARPTENLDALDHILRGRAALSKPPTRDNYAEGIGHYRRALILDPGSVEARSRLAAALVGRVLDQMADSVAADKEEAERLTQQTLAASPRNPFAHLARGLLFDAESRFVEAIGEFETALESNRNWANVVALLGKCKLLTGSIDEAVELQERAIRLSPRDRYLSIFYYRIGAARLLQSRIDEAITWLEKARINNDKHPLPHAWLAAAYGIMGDRERGIAELTEAQNRSTDDRYLSITHWNTIARLHAPKIRALMESTFLAGLRKVGMPEE